MNFIFNLIGFILGLILVLAIFSGFIFTGNIYIFVFYKIFMTFYVGRKVYKLFKKPT